MYKYLILIYTLITILKPSLCLTAASFEPTKKPITTKHPSPQPTFKPTTPKPTNQPSITPTKKPTKDPTNKPTKKPTQHPVKASATVPAVTSTPCNLELTLVYANVVKYGTTRDLASINGRKCFIDVAAKFDVFYMYQCPHQASFSLGDYSKLGQEIKMTQVPLTFHNSHTLTNLEFENECSKKKDLNEVQEVVLAAANCDSTLWDAQYIKETMIYEANKNSCCESSVITNVVVEGLPVSPVIINCSTFSSISITAAPTTAAPTTATPTTKAPTTAAPANPGPVNPGPVNPGPVNPAPVNPAPVNPVDPVPQPSP